MSVETLVAANQAIQVRKGRDWREWAVLTVAGTLAALSILPAVWDQAEQAMRAQGLGLAAFLGIQFLESLVQIAVLVAVGLFFAHRAGLGAPILEGWLTGEKVGAQFKANLVPSILLGLAGGGLAIALDRLVFRPLLPGFTSILLEVRGWQGFLASFSGGIFEELEMRLVVLSVVAWPVGRLSHTKAGKSSRVALWIATIVAALVFAQGHLSATSLTTSITPLVIARTLVLNGGLGLLFGYLYWRRGLESAMLAHFSADIVVHFILPLL